MPDREREEKTTLPLGRRELLVAAGALGGAALSSGAWAAGHESHRDHADADPGNALQNALAACNSEGERCLTHCLAAFRDGDRSLAACATKVREMLAVCSAMTTLAASGSAHRKALARVCLAACEDCAAECRKHANMHTQCRRCMEACEGVIPLLKTLSA